MKPFRAMLVPRRAPGGWSIPLLAGVLLLALLVPCAGPHVLAPMAVVPVQHDHHGGTGHDSASLPDVAADGLHCLVQPLVRNSWTTCTPSASTLFLAIALLERAAAPKAEVFISLPGDEFYLSVLNQTGTLHHQSVLFRV